MTREQRQAINDMFSAPHGFVPQAVDEMRADFVTMMARFAVPTNVRRTSTTLAGRPALLVEPQEGGRPGTILFFHGGSFVVGSPETAVALTANLVVRTGIRSLSLDYRLAPEHPFPAGVEDGVAAYRALLDGGADPGSIAFAGDSAGGGLAVTTCLAARAQGLPMPAAVVGFSASLDATRSGATMSSKEGIDPFFTRASMAYTGAMYVNGQDPLQELLAPAVVGDLTGLPPLLLQVGTNELLLDDSTRLADRARDAGVDVILDVTVDVPHVFQLFAGRLGEADQALDRAALFLSQQVAG